MGSRALAAFAACLLSLSLGGGVHAEAKSKKKPKPHLTVIGFADHQTATGNTPPGQTLRLCGSTSDKIYVYLRYRNFRHGRNTLVRWTINGVAYASLEQPWSLGRRGAAWATLVRAPSATEFGAGSYGFSFKYSGKRVVSATFNVAGC